MFANTMIHNMAELKTKTFPWKLHAMLDMAERDGFGDVVSWLPDEKSFRVHDPDAFVQKIMPNFFQQSKYKSFQRQLNLWGFERLTNGPGKGGYTRSEFFSRNSPHDISHIKRRKIKNNRLSRKKDSAQIIDNAAPKLNIENINSMSLKPIRSYSVVSVVSQSCSDVSSISSDSDCDHSRCIDSVENDDLSPMPISEMTKESDCPRTGDCLDFEGRSYFFVDEDEVEATSNAPSNILKPQFPEPIKLCPSSVAGIALYREFFFRDMIKSRFGTLPKLS